MSVQQTKYELLKEEYNSRQKHTLVQVCLLFVLCSLCSIAVYTTWNIIYRKQQLNIPPKLNGDIPIWWQKRSILIAKSYQTFFNKLTNEQNTYNHSNNINNYNKLTNNYQNNHNNIIVKQLDNERIFPSKYGNFFNSKTEQNSTKLVCYYVAPTITEIQRQTSSNDHRNLMPKNIDPYLCTHINVGIVSIADNQLVIDDSLRVAFQQCVQLKKINSNLKILLWVGGGGDTIANKEFSQMIRVHATRKQFIKSIKLLLQTYRLDGIDLDWEFPSAYDRERQHFSQLLHEIRREYEREHGTYLLSVAVAAPEGIAFFAYDIPEINNYADYVNIMTYDFHFYTKHTPFTGLNSPLYKRSNEQSIMATFNINATVNYWHKNGLDKHKIVIGLPTYGHSFRLVNPFNTKLGAPAEDIGFVGHYGYVTFSDICWFKQNNIYVTNIFDIDTCSPYLFSGTEWISYEDEQSIECKTNFIKTNGYGGAMIFSLNTDDYSSYCSRNNKQITPADKTATDNQQFNYNAMSFPLSRKIYSILFNE